MLMFGALAVIGGLFLRRCEQFSIPAQDQSLAPTHPGGSRIVCRSIDADDDLERGTDVVYAMEYEGQKRARFGRVRALPGDEVGVDDEGRITVNGETVGPIAVRGKVQGRVPEGKVFILVVNPQETNYPDSRQLGFIAREDVRAVILASLGVGR